MPVRARNLVHKRTPRKPQRAAITNRPPRTKRTAVKKYPVLASYPGRPAPGPQGAHELPAPLQAAGNAVAALQIAALQEQAPDAAIPGAAALPPVPEAAPSVVPDPQPEPEAFSQEPTEVLEDEVFESVDDAPALEPWVRKDVTKYRDLLNVQAAERGEEAAGGSSWRIRTFLTQGLHDLEHKPFTDEPWLGLGKPQALRLAKRVLKWTDGQIATLFDAAGVLRPTRVAYVRGEDDRTQYAVRLGEPLRRATDGEVLDTGDMVSLVGGRGFAIFVMDAAGNLYVGRHEVGLFHHSSFLAGGAVAAAGEIRVSYGRIEAITSKSGHYHPAPSNTRNVLRELQDAGVNLAGVRLDLYTGARDPVRLDAAEFARTGVVPDAAAAAAVPAAAPAPLVPAAAPPPT